MARIPRDQYDRFTPLRLVSRRLNRAYNRMAWQGDIHQGKGALSPTSPYNMRMIRRAQGTKKKSYRQHVNSQRLAIGKTPGTKTSRTNVLEQSPSGSSSRTLYVSTVPITDVYMSGTVDPDKIAAGRLSNHIFISGFKLDWQVNLKQPVGVIEPVVFNIAVISNKYAPTISSANFFRGHGTEIGLDFSNSRTGFDFATMSINTDQYNVLLHKRVKLWPQSYPFSGVIPERSPYMNAGPNKQWIPLKRQISFEDGTAGSNDDIYIVHWADYVDTTASTAGSANLYDLQYRCVTYYRNMLGM